MIRPSLRLGAVTLVLAAIAVLSTACSSTPEPEPTQSSAAPTATTAPEPEVTAEPTTEPAATPTCEELISDTMVADFTAVGWTVQEEVFRVGSLEIAEGVLCRWGDFTTASDHLQMFGWAPITAADASSVRSELVAPSAHALQCIGCALGARDVEDPLVAELGQVTHGRPRAPILVDRDDRGAAPGCRRRGHHRNAQIESAHDLQHVDVDDDQHDGVDALAEQPFHDAPHAGGIGVEPADGVDVVAGCAGGEVEVHRDRRGAEVRDAGRHQADRAGASGDERPGRGRRAVAELGDGVLDAGASGGSHVREVVDDARHRLVGDAGETRDVEDVGGPRRPVVGGDAPLLTHRSHRAVRPGPGASRR